MIRKHSVSLHGHKTSFSLEDAFFDELKIIAAKRDIALAALLREVDDDRPAEMNLSSALRLFVLATLKQQATHH
ncbi:ribbon-helix-helix domain-containing protein [Martelella alba]|uniref:Ribbon-helix-helix domain-containing protein n=1 Tax=Martelella alba TaxID=2590451 RepID=A0A506UIK7_9HYPH|nr:ribbon-helix-helix domain-containing protein [Martelella alba]TPW33174.1 ribbon-helix-helix domain-containing protein [Martelella alba]